MAATSAAMTGYDFPTVKKMGGSAMTDTIKYLLPEERIPRAWYNIAADLPSPPPPPLHPGTGQPIGPDDLAAIFPMALIAQEVSAEREIEIPGPGARDLQAVAAGAALPRKAAREGARYPGAHFLQVRGREPAGQPQAQHRGRAGLLQQGGRGHEALDRDRGGAMGLLARLRRRSSSASKSRSTWSRSATTRSPTGGR